MPENYYITKGQYLQFDAVTIEQYIKDVLNANSSKFTDQNFDGSYFSSIIEVISYTFNVLMFYLNQTSSESMFTDAQLYENMNRIVKMLGYNPVGYQTSIVPYTATATGLTTNAVYNIPRYSYLNAGGTSYSFASDVVFKGIDIDPAIDGSVLYQGKFYEYPLYTAEGGGNEVIYLLPGTNVTVDYFNIDVYVKGKAGVWEEWTRKDNLTDSDASANVYSVRFNEDETHEISFGNNINGKALTLEDTVAIYYLQSDGEGNEVGIGDFEGPKYIKLSSPQFTTIYADISSATNTGTIAPPENISFGNTVPSSPFDTPETVEEIRRDSKFSVKDRTTLSRVDDYARYIARIFSNIVSDVEVVDNKTYTEQYLKYFYDLGVDNPQNVSRILFNQVTYADACNFNNIYAFVKPKILAGANEYNSFLSPSFKQLIINQCNDIKLTTSEIVPMDPVYMAIDIGANDLTTTTTPDDVDETQFVIIKEKDSVRTDESIKIEVNDIFQNYFDQDTTTLGMSISFAELTESIQSVEGLVSVRTDRIDGTVSYNGISFITWNPIYESDATLVITDKTYKFFQVPYLNNKSSFADKLVIELEA